MIFLLLFTALAPLEVTDCPADVGQQIRSIMTLELETSSEVSTSSTTARIRVRCARAQTELVIEDGPHRAERQLDLSEVVPTAQARLIALALVELLRDPLSTTSFTPAPNTTSSTVSQPNAPPTFTSRTQVAGGAGIALVPSPDTFGWFAAVEVRHRFDATWGIRSHLSGSFAQKNTDLGALTMLDASIAAAALTRVAMGSWDFEASAGARVGYAWLRGEANSAGLQNGRVSGAWGGPFLGAALLAELSPEVRLGMEVESGVTLVGLVGRVDNVPTLGLDGLWFRFGLITQYDL